MGGGVGWGGVGWAVWMCLFGVGRGRTDVGVL